MNYYYTNKLGEVIGPIMHNDLLLLQEENVFDSSTQIFNEETQQWLPPNCFFRDESAPRSIERSRSYFKLANKKFAFGLIGGLVVAIIVFWIWLKANPASHLKSGSNPIKSGSSAVQLQGKVFITKGRWTDIPMDNIDILIYPLSTIQSFVDKKNSGIQVPSGLRYQVAEARSELNAAYQKGFDSSKSRAEARKSSGDSSNVNDYIQDALAKRAEMISIIRLNEVYVNLLKEEEKFYNSTSFYFDSLPEPLVKIRSNNNGEFTGNLSSPGDYAIVARSNQNRVGSNTEQYCWMVKFSVDEDSREKSVILSNDNITLRASEYSLVKTLRNFNEYHFESEGFTVD